MVFFLNQFGLSFNLSPKDQHILSYVCGLPNTEWAITILKHLASHGEEMPFDFSYYTQDGRLSGEIRKIFQPQNNLGLHKYLAFHF